MGVESIGDIACRLMEHGRSPETQAALILNPGLPGQRPVAAPLGELARKAATYGLRGDFAKARDRDFASIRCRAFLRRDVAVPLLLLEQIPIK